MYENFGLSLSFRKDFGILPTFMWIFSEFYKKSIHTFIWIQETLGKIVKDKIQSLNLYFGNTGSN